MRIRVGIALLSVALLFTACGEAEAACGEAFAERLDSKSSVHLLPGDKEPRYQTDPPTSGAHRAGGVTAGVSELELDKPTQVNLLEQGGVLLQYSEELSDNDLDRLRLFAGEDVVVAPNDGLDERIVATAWLHKMECRRVDIRALQAFIDDHVGKGPGH